MFAPADRGWRKCIAFWPLPLRQKWADITANHEKTGLPWYEAEWRSFLYLANYTYKYEQENPHKPIPWQEPFETPDINIYECSFLVNQADIELIRHHNKNLQLPEETKKMLAERMAAQERMRAERAKIAQQNSYADSPSIKRWQESKKLVVFQKGKKSKHDPRTKNFLS